jgi:hypothetical protein
VLLRLETTKVLETFAVWCVVRDYKSFKNFCSFITGFLKLVL